MRKVFGISLALIFATTAVANAGWFNKRQRGGCGGRPTAYSYGYAPAYYPTPAPQPLPTPQVLPPEPVPPATDPAVVTPTPPAVDPIPVPPVPPDTNGPNPHPPGTPEHHWWEFWKLWRAKQASPAVAPRQTPF
jgi:hypothetical protein